MTARIAGLLMLLSKQERLIDPDGHNRTPHRHEGESCLPSPIPFSRARARFVQLLRPVQRMSLAPYMLPLSAGSSLWMCVLSLPQSNPA